MNREKHILAPGVSIPDDLALSIVLRFFGLRQRHFLHVIVTTIETPPSVIESSDICIGANRPNSAYRELSLRLSVLVF